MPLVAPDLDTRDFDALVAMLRLRIPRYTPEWTDFNYSDPGATLVDLFAWLTEMLLHQMNRVPERNYVKFLQLLNMELEPAQPAVASLTFTPDPGAVAEPIRQRSRVAAQAANGDLVVFETVAGLDLVRAPLADIQVFDGSGYDVVTDQNNDPRTTFRPLGWEPQANSALLLGFATDPAPTPPVFPRQMRLRATLPAAARSNPPERCDSAARPPAPPVTLVWEYKPNATDPWRRLQVFEDESAAFTRDGAIILQGPATIEPVALPDGKVTEPRYWLRCRLTGPGYPKGKEPEIDFIRPNVVEAESLTTVREEIIGEADGTPGQRLTLDRTPVQPASLELIVTLRGGDEELWERRDDFLASGSQATHFVLNATTGEVRFGDGRRGRIPEAGAEIKARVYRYGGGAAGNVRDGQITLALTSFVGVQAVTNERPATGGRDEQSLDDLKLLAPERLRHRSRAVSEADFAALAAEVGGVRKATAIALAHPDFRDVEVPGAVTVVVVPDTDDMPPLPSSDLMRRVCTYLDERRLLTTEVYVAAPQYQKVRVEAVVTAKRYASFDAVKRDVIASLNEYLSPVGRRPAPAASDEVGGATEPAGGANAPGRAAAGAASQGWTFGRNLTPTSLYSVILRVPDVDAVRDLAVWVDDVPHEPLSKLVEVPPDGLLYGAPDHSIDVIPAEEA